ncbi:hypothetical protein KALB_5249 [Kutzneria albida DSM 43870]|uniref:MalT-like TPR region domain-containing protein n=1 Tax=Kutzneria albida DSM 43870 TaxID=1449976 RepID=W5WDF8_9PSEU|nr:hypothetical protein KALB_5249 [Kutzneria albida DSM 43870]
MINQSQAARGLHWTGAVLRFLTHALRPDTHHSDSWPEWEVAFPHVTAVCTAAEQGKIQLGDVAYLLDRTSVYAREAAEDPDLATELAEHAADLAVTLEDAELISHCLGNLALAHRAANRIAEAIRASEKSIACVAEAFGIDNEKYAESLTVHAGILAAGGRTSEAAQAHDWSVKILKKLHAKRPSDVVRGLLVEALNDHASHLLSTGGPVQLGRQLLEEANRLLKRGEYGWTQVTLNLARACRESGDAEDARDRLVDLRDYCESNALNPSLVLLAVVADLAEVYHELGDRRAAATLREAHRVDNALVEALDRPLREGRTS